MRVENLVYLDHQATTPIDPQARAEMEPYLSDVFGNPHSSEHFFGWTASKAIDKARAEIASLIGADSDEIIFTSGATEANNLAILGLLEFFKSTGRSNLLTSKIEHKSIMNISLNLSLQKKIESHFVGCDKFGLVDIENIKALVERNNFAIFSIAPVNNEIGTIQRYEIISQIAKDHGAIIHFDASQGPCATDIDVNELCIDLLSLSSHKIYGPKGVGALYVRRDLQKHMIPMIIGGGQENGLRGGTLPTSQCVGFGAAARILKAHIAKGEREKLRSLKELFLSELSKADIDFSINGPSEELRHPGNLNLCFHGFVAQDLLMAIQPHVAASSGSACNSAVVEPSYVLKAIGLTEENARASIRFSFGRYTTEEDIKFSTKHIIKAITALRE